MLHRLRSTWISYTFFVGVPTLILIAALVTGWDLSQPGLFGFPIWALLFGGYVFMFVYMPLIQMVQLLLSRRGNRKLFGTRTQLLTQEGFSSSGDGFNASFTWDAIPKAVETKHFFLIYITSRIAHYIPKARLTEPADTAQLRAVLRNCLHERAQFLSPA